MQGKFNLIIKISFIFAGVLLTGWIAYWAGFSKALQIGLYINQRNDLSQALEYDQLTANLKSGKVEEVRAHLKGLSNMLKEQASLQGSETNSVLDLLIPTGGLSLVRDYNANRAKALRARPVH